jgi:hypothetical protein
MVNAVGSSEAQVIPTAPASVAPVGNGTTPAFSVSSIAGNSSPVVASADSVAAAASSASASQTSDGANDFRQLFNGIVPLATPYTTRAASDAMNFGPSPNLSVVSGAALPASPAAATSVQPPFVPVFQGATVTDGTNVWQLNPTYFADPATAQWIANKYGTGQVVQTPFFDGGGPYSASASMNQIVLANGDKVNAGILAAYYARNPESEFPGLADTLIQSQLAQLDSA